MTNHTETRLLTRREVSDLLGFRGRTGHSVRRLELRGLLPRVVINERTIRYRREDVEKLISGARVEVPASR